MVQATPPFSLRRPMKWSVNNEKTSRVEKYRPDSSTIPTLSASPSSAIPTSAPNSRTAFERGLTFRSIGSGCSIPGKLGSGVERISKTSVSPPPRIFGRIPAPDPCIASTTTFIFSDLIGSMLMTFLSCSIYGPIESSTVSVPVSPVVAGCLGEFPSKILDRCASICATSSGVADPPTDDFILNPFHSAGLWLAVIITPLAADWLTTAKLQAGVGAATSKV